MEKPIFLLLSHRSPGLAQDRVVVAGLLEGMGHEVYIYDLPPSYYLQGLPVPIPDGWKGRAIAIMFEHIFVFSVRPIACLLYVNPEWIVAQDRSRLLEGAVDFLLVKSRDAFQRLSSYVSGIEIVYTGFASIQLPCLPVSMDYNKAIHVRGFAQQKGTDIVLKAYQGASRGLPECICTMRTFDPAVPSFVASIGTNCKLIFRDLDQKALNLMAARRGLHLCPSEREGFGHYIFGPMGLGAVVLTADAPPMNELVDLSCGLLVPARTEDRELYLNARVTAADLSAALSSFLTLQLDQKMEMGRLAIEKVASLRSDFEQRFHIFINLLLSSFR